MYNLNHIRKWQCWNIIWLLQKMWKYFRRKILKNLSPPILNGVCMKILSLVDWVIKIIWIIWEKGHCWRIFWFFKKMWKYLKKKLFEYIAKLYNIFTFLHLMILGTYFSKVDWGFSTEKTIKNGFIHRCLHKTVKFSNFYF